MCLRQERALDLRFLEQRVPLQPGVVEHLLNLATGVILALRFRLEVALHVPRVCLRAQRNEVSLDLARDNFWNEADHTLL